MSSCFCKNNGRAHITNFTALVSNLLNNILLPSRTELALFKCLASPIAIDEIEIDIDEH